jgi:hypothetical protein
MAAYFGTHKELRALFEKIYSIPGILPHDSCTVWKPLKAEYQYTLTELEEDEF